MRKRWAGAVIAAVIVARVATGATTAEAAENVLGSGSTFAAVALEQWAGDIYVAQGLGVEYRGNGSLGGLSQYQQGVVDFASSDVPYPPGTDGGRNYAYVPIVAGGTALMYNLPDQSGARIDNLRLSPETVADIFFGTIRNWNDEAIKRENPALVDRLPDLEIKLAVRTSGSGTTGVFTDFLSTATPQKWNDFVARSGATTRANGNYVTDWPSSNAQFNCWCNQYPGSSEIANEIAQNTGSARGTIGYAEAAYAKQLGLPVVRIRNQAGFYRLPDARSVAVALLEATENGDGTQNLESVHLSTREEAYPASSYNYLVIPLDDAAGFTAGKGESLSKYLIYSVTEGQASADFLGYSPLPPNLVQFALNRVSLIPGAAEAPPLGDWGRFYEELAPEVVVEVDETPDLSPGGVDPNVDPNAVDPNAVVDPAVELDAAGNPISRAGGAGPAGGTGQTPGATTTTTTTVAGATPGATGTQTPAGRRTTATSIAADGSIVYLEEDAVSGSSRVALSRGLEFDDEGNLVSKDGQPVPEVKSIGIGQLLGITGVLAGLVLLPPLVIGGIIRRRQDELGPPVT